MLCCVTLVGCGSGVVTSTLPGAAMPAAGVPAGAMLGYVFSPVDGTLRAILGVSGSARMSASVVPHGVYVAGEASVASGTGLLEDAGGSLFVLSLPGSLPVHVADHLPAPARVAFAPSGQIAVAYASGSSALWLISGLPSAPQVQTIHIAAGYAPNAAVVSDAGTIVIAEGSGPVAVETLSMNGATVPLLQVGTSGGMSFLAGADTLLLADQAANTATVLEHVSSGAAIRPLSAVGLHAPVSIAGSRDGHWAVAANGGDAAVVRMDLIGGTAAVKMLCACQPAQMLPLQGGAAFRLNGLYNGPVWTVDVTGSDPQLLFIPGIPAATP